MSVSYSAPGSAAQSHTNIFMQKRKGFPVKTHLHVRNANSSLSFSDGTANLHSICQLDPLANLRMARK